MAFETGLSGFPSFLTCGSQASDTCCVPQSCCVDDFVKNPVSDLRISHSWADFLLSSGERAITNVTWGIFNVDNEVVLQSEISLVSPSHDPYSDTSRITVRGGVNGRTYRIYLRGNTCPGCVQEQVCFGLTIKSC